MRRASSLAAAVTFVVAAFCVAQNQTPAPSLAAPPAQTPATPSTEPSLAPPPKNEVPKSQTAFRPKPKDDSFCFADPEGVYSKENQKVPKELQGPTRSYLNLLYMHVFTEWGRHLSFEERKPWGKKTDLPIRLAIRPDGSYEQPELTRSSGKDKYDAHALQAISASPSFPELPKGWTHPLLVCLRMGFNEPLSQMNFDRYDRWQDDAEKKHP